MTTRDVFETDSFNALVDDRLQACGDEFVSKNRWLLANLEFIARLLGMSCFGGRSQIANRDLCHYYHEPRFTHLDVPECFHFCTSHKKFSVGSFNVRVLFRILTHYISLRRSISPRSGFAKLALLDLAAIAMLIDDYGIKRFHIAAHFQPYVGIISELRRSGVIEYFAGRQHGAFEKLPLVLGRARLHYDAYRLMNCRFETPFRQYVCGNEQVQIISDPSAKRIEWKTHGEPHVAMAFQGDDFPPDRLIFDIVCDVCSELKMKLIAYPHPKASKATKDRIAKRALLETSQRFGDSICMVTGFSTLGFEFAVNLGTTLFVEIDDRSILFDTDGLFVRTVTLEELRTALVDTIQSRKLAGSN